MEGTDVEQYKSVNYDEDHTYYGNGCTNAEHTPGKDGSDVSCSTRIIQSFDQSEDQSIGVYYDYQAATAATGRLATTDNTNSPDTFCPLGWQMPYSGTGGDYYDKTKSWTFLLNKYGYGPDASGFARFASYPLSNIRSGSYYWYRGLLQYMKTNILQWSITTKYNASSAAYWINAWSTMIKLPDLGNQLMGVSIRCVFSNFIDGTVEGTDISSQDVDINHDHSYFGNGCAAEEGGSTISCTDNKVLTQDNEEQIIGVYYNYQSATSGSGATEATDNTNVSDSFCPLGWQLPYGGTGGDYYDKSKSIKYLFDDYNISSIESAKIRSYPFSLIRAGSYNWNNGKLWHMSIVGNYWYSTINTLTNAYSYMFWSTNLNNDDPVHKARGYSVRCIDF